MDDERPSDEVTEVVVEEVDAVPAPAEDALASPGTVELPPAAREELAGLRREAAQWRESYLRKLADYDNYRKRQEREISDFRRTANAALLRECLPVIDNLERALAVPGDGESGLRTGVSLVLRQFKEVLARGGVVELDPVGESFDPALHEAVSRQEVEDGEANTVVEVLQKGYLYGERLLRPALVVVAVQRPRREASGAGEESRGEP